MRTTSYNYLLGFYRSRGAGPAMNSNMWAHPATQENLNILRKRGHVIVEPEDGLLACGMTGPGRLAEPDRLADVVASLGLGSKISMAKPFSLPPGPRRKPLDPVRFISNRSSGKMGYALAEVAGERGARVVLISGPCIFPRHRASHSFASTLPLKCEMRSSSIWRKQHHRQVRPPSPIYLSVFRTQSEEDCYANVARVGPPAGYPRRAWPEKG